MERIARLCATAALLATACASKQLPTQVPPPTGTLPAWLAYHHVDHGVTLTGVVVHAQAERKPTASLAKLVRVVVSAGDGYENQVANLDSAGAIREPAADARETAVVPFSSPIADYSPTPATWWPHPYHSAILASGELEIIAQGSRYTFANPEGFTSIADGCLAHDVPPTTPIPCFGRVPWEGSPIVLEQDSTIGPLSRVEWNALKNLNRDLLAAWEQAGGPRKDAEVLQIAGGWGKHEDTWHRAYRPALVCGVLADHTVACWGTSDYYELGDGIRSSETRYVRVPELRDVAEVAVGPSFACARTLDGHVACWGDASAGAFPLPKHPRGGAVPGCKLDEDATERTYRARVASSRERAAACMRSECAPGTLDCHLGCGPNDPPRELIYRHDGACTTSKVFGRPQQLDLSDVISIGAGNAKVCFVFANGYTTCGGG